MFNQIAEIAAYHYYLVREIIDLIPDNKTIPDLLHNEPVCCEDELVITIYPFSCAYWRVIDEFYKQDLYPNGVILYDTPRLIAALFLSSCVNAKLPNLKEFEHKCRILLKEFVS